MKKMLLPALIFTIVLTNQVFAQSLLELKTNSFQKCQQLCSGLHSSECNMAYYFKSGPTKGYCRFTKDRNPQINAKGRYVIYSRWLGRQVKQRDICIHWKHLDPKKCGVTQRPAKKASCRWAPAGTGDVPYNDLTRSNGSQPLPSLCERNSTISAVCWSSGSPAGGGPWCTYKSLPASQVRGGGNPGSLYRCQC